MIVPHFASEEPESKSGQESSQSDEGRIWSGPADSKVNAILNGKNQERTFASCSRLRLVGFLSALPTI